MPEGANIKTFAGYTTSIFVAGWATGGLIFGSVGDRIGRAKTLTITVLLYSLFTGLSALSTSWIDFAIYRFITGLGVGGVFGLAVALIADTLSEGSRTWALGVLQAFFGMLSFAYLAQRTGRRFAFVIAFIGAFVATNLYFRMFQGVDQLWMSGVMGFFQLALFAGFAIYLPELFPTRLRSTGTSFCYNVGRFLAATGPFTLGLLQQKLGEFAIAKLPQTANSVEQAAARLSRVTAKASPGVKSATIVWACQSMMLCYGLTLKVRPKRISNGLPNDLGFIDWRSKTACILINVRSSKIMTIIYS